MNEQQPNLTLKMYIYLSINWLIDHLGINWLID